MPGNHDDAPAFLCIASKDKQCRAEGWQQFRTVSSLVYLRLDSHMMSNRSLYSQNKIFVYQQA